MQRVEAVRGTKGTCTREVKLAMREIVGVVRPPCQYKLVAPYKTPGDFELADAPNLAKINPGPHSLGA